MANETETEQLLIGFLKALMDEQGLWRPDSATAAPASPQKELAHE